MGQISDILNTRYQAKTRTLSAVVQSVPRNSDGKQLGYITAKVAGQSGVKVYVGPNDVYYPGDYVTVEQKGKTAAANYFVSSLHAASRPKSGVFEFSDTTSIGEQEFDIGDLLFGDPTAANWWFDYDKGVMYLRTGGVINGSINSEGYVDLGNPNGAYLHLANNTIEFRNGDTVLSGIDAEGRTIYGIERWGRPHGPGIETREFLDDTGETRYIWSILGSDGRVGVSFVTGNTTNPDDYKFYLGPEGSEQRFLYDGGEITYAGKLIIFKPGFTNTNWAVQIDPSATYPLSVGHVNPGSAPFKVDWNGNVYATSVKTLQGNAGSNYTIDINSGGNYAIRGTGDSVGVYGSGNAYGVEGYTSGGNAKGVYGHSSGGIGVHGKGDTGIWAEMNSGGDAALTITGGPLIMNSQNITSVNRIYFSSTTYLYLSGTDIYWYNGSTGTKLN